MDSEKFIHLFLAFVVGVILVGSVFVPLAVSSTNRTVESDEIYNEGAEWLKLVYGEGSSINFGFMPIYSDDTLTIGSQTGIDEDMILYADDENSLISYGENLYFITPDKIHKFDKGADLSISVTNGSGSVIIHGIPTIPLSPSWAYYPDVTGNYGFFYDGGLTLEEGKPTVAVGTYAQAFGYNTNPVLDINGAVLDMIMSGSPSDSVTWVKDTSSVSDEIQEIGPLTPLDPSIIQPIDLDKPEPSIIQTADPTTGTRIGDLYYTFVGTNARVIGYASTINWASFTSIPDTVESGGVVYTVTSIWDNAFRGCTNLALTSLPDSITSIGTYAFYGCTNLLLTSLPDGITSIGSRAFEGCTNLALTSLPDGITSIEPYSFRNCTNLALTSLPSGVTSIQSSAFNGCTNLALTSLPSGVTTIQASAFASCTNLALTSLPSGVTTIGNYAFEGCTNLALTSLPSGVTSIGQYAFRNCQSMNTLIIQSSPTFNTNSFNDTMLEEVLNLGDSDFSSIFSQVQDYIGALGYIAPSYIPGSEITPIGGATSTIIHLLPLVAGLGLLLMAVGMMIYRRV